MSSGIQAIRRAFPFLAENLYFNTAAVGLCPDGFGAAAAHYFDEIRSRGYTARRLWRDFEHDTAHRLARLLEVPREDVSFTSSTTEALNLVARSLRLSPGDRVVFAADDFPSVRLAWEGWRRAGVELVSLPIADETRRTDALAAAVDARTKVLCVSHVHWNTGTRLDLPRLAAACSRHGALLVVDGAQAVGAVEVDASCADVYAGPTFKWLLADFGLGFLVVRRELRERLEPVFLGYANEPPARSLRYSHLNHSAIGMLGRSLEYLESVGWPLVLGRVAALADRLSTGLDAAGWRVLTPRDRRAGIVSIAHAEPGVLTARLEERRCFAEPREGLVRFSTHFYNSEEDVDRLLDLLEQVRRR